MRPLIVEDLISIKIYVTQLIGDLFIFENHILSGKLVFYIKGKSGPIPKDFALKVIEELEEYRYVAEQIELMGFGNSVIITGMGEL